MVDDDDVLLDIDTMASKEGDDGVSAYEAARLANIQKNNELLLSLGLAGASTLFEPVKDQTKPRPKPARALKREASVGADEEEDNDHAAAGPSSRRVSARRSTSSSASYNLLELTRAAHGRGSSTGSASTSQRGSSRASSSSSRIEAKPRTPGTRSSARLSAQSPKKGRYHDISDSEDSSRDLASPIKRAPYTMPGGSPLAKVHGPRLDPSEDIDGTAPYEEYERQPLPRLGGSGTRGKGRIVFEDRWKVFTPNLTPAEMMRGGMFGGTAFRRHYSSITHSYLDPQTELAALPQEWLQGIDPATHLTRTEYEPSINRFGVKASQSLAEWEKAGWVRPWDPRGWWGWYVAFFQGRRCSDDACQISRWLKAAGPTGRFKRALIKEVARTPGGRYDDDAIAPVLRQTCWHWAVELTKDDYEEAVPQAAAASSTARRR